MSLTVLTKVSFLQEMPSHSLVNHQKHEITFHSTPDGKVTCNLSKKGVLVAKNIPLVTDPHGTPPLSSRTITYYPSQNLVVWGSYGLKGGMNSGTPGHSTTEIKGGVKSKGTGVLVIDGSFHVDGDFKTGDIYKGLTPDQIRESALNRMAKNPTENLPGPQYDFIGREELLISLAKRLIPVQYEPHNPSTIQILQGPPGIGKTELAITFANQHAASFCKIWFIHAETSLESDYQQLAESLKISIKPDEPLSEVQKKVHLTLQELAAHTQKPYLLIFDNVEAKLTCTIRGGVLLLTARHQAIYKDQSVYEEVRPFTLDDVKALYKRLFDNEPPQELEELLRESEGFPLVIRAIFQITNHPEAFKAIFEESKSQKSLQEHTEDRYEKKLGDVFATLLKKFKNQNKEAYQLLEVISHFSPDTIPLSLIHFYGASEGFTEPQTWALIDALTASLARYTDKTKTTFAIHRITQTTCKALQPDATSYTRALALLGEFVKDFGGNKPNTWSIGQIGATHYPFVHKSPHWEKGDPNVKFVLMNRLGYYWNQVGGYEAALAIASEALELAISTYEENHPNVAASYCNMAVISGKLRRYDEAFGAYKKALELRKELLDSSRPLVAISKKLEELRKERLLIRTHTSVAISYDNVGVILDSLGQDPEWLEAERVMLNLVIDLLARNHTPNSLGNLKQHAEDLETFKKALESSFLAKNHPAVAMSYNAVGNALGNLRLYKDALRAHEKALELRIGENHRDIAATFTNCNMENFLDNPGKYPEGLNAHKKALELLGEKHQEVAAIYGNIGNVLGNLGRYADALKAHEKALWLRFGEKHLDIAEIYDKVGNISSNLGQYAKALQVHIEAFKLRKELLEKTHPAIMRSYETAQEALIILKAHCLVSETREKVLDLQKTSKDKGLLAEAERVYRDALELQKKLLREKDLDVADNCDNIGNSSYDPKACDKIFENYKQTFNTASDYHQMPFLSTKQWYGNFSSVKKQAPAGKNLKNDKNPEASSVRVVVSPQGDSDEKALRKIDHAAEQTNQSELQNSPTEKVNNIRKSQETPQHSFSERDQLLTQTAQKELGCCDGCKKVGCCNGCTKIGCCDGCNIQ